jgi:hypothetical protein
MGVKHFGREEDRLTLFLANLKFSIFWVLQKEKNKAKSNATNQSPSSATWSA